MSDRNYYIQQWYEMERGWGGSPDGYSIHRSQEDANAFIKEYWDGMPDSAPDVYSKPTGALMLLVVESEIADKVDESVNGVRVYNWEPKIG